MWIHNNIIGSLRIICKRKYLQATIRNCKIILFPRNFIQRRSPFNFYLDHIYELLSSWWLNYLFYKKNHNYIIWWFAFEKCACLLPNLGMKEIKSPEETIARIYFARQKNDFEIFTSCPSYPEGVKMFTTMHNFCCCFWYIKVDHHHK